MNVDFNAIYGAKSVSSSASASGSSVCFPVKEGRVHAFAINPEGEKVEFDFGSYDDLYILDGYEDPDSGMKAHSLRGHQQSFLAKGIFTQVHRDDMEDARFATCVYLTQIQKAIDASEPWVNTIFGLKFLDWKKAKAPKAKSHINFMSFL